MSAFSPWIFNLTTLNHSHLICLAVHQAHVIKYQIFQHQQVNSRSRLALAKGLLCVPKIMTVQQRLGQAGIVLLLLVTIRHIIRHALTVRVVQRATQRP